MNAAQKAIERARKDGVELAYVMQVIEGWDSWGDATDLVDDLEEEDAEAIAEGINDLERPGE